MHIEWEHSDVCKAMREWMAKRNLVPPETDDAFKFSLTDQGLILVKVQNVEVLPEHVTQRNKAFKQALAGIDTSPTVSEETETLDTDDETSAVEDEMYIDVKNDDKAESNISNDSENLETKRKLAPSIEKEMSDLFTSQGLKPPENLLKQAKGIKLIKPATHDNKQFFNPLHEKF